METTVIKKSNQPRKRELTTRRNTVSEETHLRILIDAWANALRSRDIEGMMTHYAPDVTVFGITPPLEYMGVEAHRRYWQGMFASFEGRIGYDFSDLSITVGETIAFCHSLNHISGKTKNDGDGGTWIRVTVCCRKVGGKWMVTHEHVSVPFDTVSGKASVDLEPD